MQRSWKPRQYPIVIVILDAQFTVHRGETHYGYKGHIGMDDQTDVIHTVEFTAANVHDSNKFDELLLSTEKRLHADKGYANKERRIASRKAGITPKIMHKGYWDQPLTKNRLLRTRYTLEPETRWKNRSRL